MNQHSLHQGDPPGQIIRLAPAELRDSQGRSLDVAQYQDRSQREEDALRRLGRVYRPLLILDRACDIAARAVVCCFPFSVLLLWMLITFEMPYSIGLVGLSGALIYLVLYAAWIGPSLQAALRRLHAEAQANGVDLDAAGAPPGELNS